MEALDQFLDTVTKLQNGSSHAIRIVQTTELEHISHVHETVFVNSIVFVLQGYKYVSEAGYVLAVLDDEDRVDLTRLEEAINSTETAEDGDERHRFPSLASTESLVGLCGFESGTVPPLGLSPPPLLTLVEASLVNRSDVRTKGSSSMLVAGGGQHGRSTLLPVQTLLDSAPNVRVAHFRENRSSVSESGPHLGTPESPSTTASRPKPYFVVAPPDDEAASAIVAHTDLHVESLQPEWVVVVGRISSIRSVARRLVFADLAPPSFNQSTSDEDKTVDYYPWRNPRTQGDMAVQLVLGKTICQQMGGDEAEWTIRRLRVGQLVLIRGKTNVANRDSLRNWISKTSLDVVVHEVETLHREADGDVWGSTPPTVTEAKGSSATKKRQNQSRQSKHQPAENLSFLSLADIFPDGKVSEAVCIVETLHDVKQVHEDIDGWLRTFPSQIGMVGLDCEWKPNQLANNEVQPVLLLQLSLHPLQRVYLLDLQALLRAECLPTEPTTELESAVADLIGVLYQSPRLVKVGFQVANDLRKLVSSYPNIHQFQEVSSVLEVSKFGMTVLQMTKQPKSRPATASLAALVERVVGRKLNKEMQVSDWSVRPFSPRQVEYAALDAAVTPHIATLLCHDSGASFELETARLVRRPHDVAFAACVCCWRFFLLHETNTVAIRRWNAQRVGGASYLVSQTWNSGDKPPKRPSLPGDDGHDAYFDLSGTYCVPSESIPMHDTSKVMERLLGTWTGKNKEECILELVGGAQNIPFDGNRWKLDYPTRAGYIEMANAVVLFVTLPHSDGRGQSRSYPNEWLENGAILTWFVKEIEWKAGASALAQKMTASTVSPVLLFVRRGKGPFLCCGRCGVVSPPKGIDTGAESDQWSISKLHLSLLDYARLQSMESFHGVTEAA